jgi:hypothetical protein
VLAISAPAPALPYVTRGDASDDLIDHLRGALGAAMNDPSLAPTREALFLEGMTILDERAYEMIARMADAAAAHGYPDIA